MNSFRSILRAFFQPIADVLGPIRVQKIKQVVGFRRLHDEVRIIASAIIQVRGGKGVMVDVGAHQGESFFEFARSGWQVHCFEPNPYNAERIQKFSKTLNGEVNLFQLAVSETSKKNLKFYLSNQSSGISSLHPFHKSHKYSFNVDAISLADYFRKYQISHVDLLKIDAEGHDFFVLKGLDWVALQPDIILCEFEDTKTRALGYTYDTMADYLVNKGYHVILSEWYPIQQYGAKHKWRRFADYPRKLEDPNGWGNLIAVRNVSDLNALRKEMKKMKT